MQRREVLAQACRSGIDLMAVDTPLEEDDLRQQAAGSGDETPQPDHRAKQRMRHVEISKISASPNEQGRVASQHCWTLPGT